MSTDLLISVAPPPKSKSQQLAKLLPGIEAALREGHGHEAIYEHIKNAVGIELTYKYYKTTLHRIRKKRDQALKDTAQPSLLPPVRKAAGATGQAGQDAGPAPNQPDRRFMYDLKGSVEGFF